MPEPWPEWVRPAFELRFLERSIEAFHLDEVNELAQQQDELATELKLQLTSEQYRQILEWEENLNFRCTIEKEWLYFAGLKDGLTFWKHLVNILPDE
ncbi:hypothetical protein [Paenibacillus mesotrionivorans]|uniref:Uncharacterized protein n=1 Tax=Paenibacillus mesotrionivorans TaxID=3160968 RepID=A0ACC7P5D6_9BACL